MSKITATSKRDWWAPIWTGLVMDQSAKHYQAMGSAVWLYLYLILNADRQSGFLVRKTKTIASHTGIKERTIRRWIRVLKVREYISTRNTGRSLLIQVTLWKTLPGRQFGDNQSGKNLPTRAAKSYHFFSAAEDKKAAKTRQKNKKISTPNDITITKDILKNDIDIKAIGLKDKLDLQKHPSNTDKKHLASQIANALNDQIAFPLYLAYAQKYPETVLKKVLGLVVAIPKHKIKKSRGALFNYLIQQYAKNKE